MVIKQSDRMVEANEQLKHILEHEEIGKVKGLKIGSYQNGREQGYSIFFEHDNVRRGVTFAQAKGSDDMVAYWGGIEDRGLSMEAFNIEDSFMEADYENTADSIVAGIIEITEGIELEGEIEYEPSLATAIEVVDAILNDKRNTEEMQGWTESLQDEGVHGLRLAVKVGNDFQDFGFSMKDDSIAVYQGKHAMQGVPEGPVRYFKKGEIEDICHHFYLTLMVG